MFKIGQTVICVDETFSVVIWSKGTDRGSLQYLKQYIVDDYSDGFVVLSGIRGEWHESRFILASSYAA